MSEQAYTILWNQMEQERKANYIQSASSER
jgi:hypothetical protein